MTFQRSTLLAAAVLMLGSFAVDRDAQAALLNVAAGKTYAYYGVAPGEGAYYMDDGHAVHTTGLGAFSTGQLTDGLVQTGPAFAQADLPSPDVALLGAKGSVIIDLGGLYSISSLSLGTNRFGQYANYRPENVNLFFSSSGLASGNFSAPILWDVPTDTNDGQVTFNLTLASAITARYVQFDFATPGQPTNEIHFDELGVFGTGVVTTNPAPEPATLLLVGAGLLGAAARRRRAG